jgi:hypothetical protein
VISQVDPYNAFLYSSDVNFKHNGEICPESHGFQATNTSNRFPGRNFFVFSEEKFLLPPEIVTLQADHMGSTCSCLQYSYRNKVGSLE